MLPDNIDDLFRGQLDGHATPPGDALWARLQARPAADAPGAERLDRLFQHHLGAHATPPARPLWERLEDEHLRPRQRRAAAWWPVALAAAVALLLVAGGAGLWLGFPGRNAPAGAVASRPPQRPAAKSWAADHQAPGSADVASEGPAATKEASASPAAPAAATSAAVAAKASALTRQPAPAAANQKMAATQATRRAALASAIPKARRPADQPRPRHPLRSPQPSDATAAVLPPVARPLPANAPARPAADERRLPPAPALAGNTSPAPAAETAAAGTVITVDVRNGAAPASGFEPGPRPTLAAAAEPRRLGGRLLQQAGHLVRGERVSLAEVTGLPENVTLRATLAGRSVSKSIQL